MGCAPMGHVLYDEVMRYNPKNPFWFNRDRFVLSAGHGCMLQYALLHLAGYDSVKVTPKNYLGQVDLLKSFELLCFFVFGLRILVVLVFWCVVIFLVLSFQIKSVFHCPTRHIYVSLYVITLFSEKYFVVLYLMSIFVFIVMFMS